MAIAENRYDGTYAGYLDSVRNESVNVGTSSQVICNARQGGKPRRVVTIRNMSPNAADVITVWFGAGTAVSGAGIVLRQYESFTDSADGEIGKGYEPYQGNISAICATAAGVVAIMER